MKLPDQAKLPVVTETDECGGGCDRRLVLKGLTIATVAGACRIDVGGDDPADAAGSVDAPDPGFEACGNMMVCVDLAKDPNASLANVGGSRVIIQGNTRIIIIRTGTDTFVTLSARCTHAGTTVGYRPPPMDDIRCPNHGSQFNLDGTVKLGPAASPLTEFQNTFDAGTMILTIML
jgi:cytochrome b6-f complex iron-sulfur subunit